MDPAKVAGYLEEWIRDRVRESGTRGVVVGLSGGVDSAVVAALASRAVPGAVMALILPAHSDPRDVEDARAVAQALGVPARIVDLGPLFDAALEAFERAGAIGAAVARANLKPRLRMTALYYFANDMNYLVAGTGNRSELEVGYFTKYGDGGVDLLPIGGLVKTQVWELARFLGVPERVIERVPTAGLWPGQTDEGEMGLAYADLDRYILTGAASPDVRSKVEAMRTASEHKRRLPPVAVVPAEYLA